MLLDPKPLSKTPETDHSVQDQLVFGISFVSLFMIEIFLVAMTTTDEDWAAEVDEQERQISGEVSYCRRG